MRRKSLALFILTALVGVATMTFWPANSTKAWKTVKVKSSPLQGPNFDHQLHTQKVGLDCRYCHSGVDRHKNAGLPSVENCMGCHSYIKKDSKKLETLRQSYLENKPLSWEVSSRIPDHAHFPHKQHIRAGLKCQTCHGNVTERSQNLKNEKPLTMQWCLKCHDNPKEAVHYELNLNNWTEEKSVKMRDCQQCHH